MKKVLFVITLVLMIGLSASAQYDNFFKWEDDENRVYNEVGFVLPNSHGSTINSEAPLDCGLLVLTALGGAYALAKRRK